MSSGKELRVLGVEVWLEMSINGQVGARLQKDLSARWGSLNLAGVNQEFQA